MAAVINYRDNYDGTRSQKIRKEEWSTLNTYVLHRTQQGVAMDTSDR